MKVGVLQCACAGLDFDRRLERLGAFLRRGNVDLVVCPELYASGYNVADTLPHLAQPATGRFFESARTLARISRTAIAFGYPEKDGDLLYNSAAFVSADGELLANHRKRRASPHSFEETTFANGQGQTVFDYGGIRLAIVICYEVEFPESVRAAARAGAQLVLAPTALVKQWKVVAERVIPARAFENGVWLAYANHAGEENGFEYLGGSRIVAPDGSEAAVASDEEALISARIDSGQVEVAQARLPYLRDAHALT